MSHFAAQFLHPVSFQFAVCVRDLARNELIVVLSVISNKYDTKLYRQSWSRVMLSSTSLLVVLILACLTGSTPQCWMHRWPPMSSCTYTRWRCSDDSSRQRSPLWKAMSSMSNMKVTDVQANGGDIFPNKQTHDRAPADGHHRNNAMTGRPCLPRRDRGQDIGTVTGVDVVEADVEAKIGVPQHDWVRSGGEEEEFGSRSHLLPCPYEWEANPWLERVGRERGIARRDVATDREGES
ncbi:hypothetical protein GUJ93_ZPchr0014g47401 [Zizania palustris]|uniref:Uncharacterized protein n=1 Tax=Zizania palustris TaxID=103762 RepID=A0A8J5W5P8_ZIZPA|nr:hypothetical protein GUJ93_ZPchr0014g47401 [Zizania palustris]